MLSDDDNKGGAALPPLPASLTIETSERATTKVDIPRREGDLTERTMVSLREKFKTYNHSPSDDQMDGLEQVASVIQGMADGTLKDKNFYVSFLSPGIGKTSTVIEAVRHLTEMECYEETGAIIFLFRVEEIAKLVEAMNLKDDEFSVLVSDAYEENLLGNQHKQQARVMFTTQQQLEARCRGTHSFEEIGAFHFRGQPRQVRIWDEAILPSRHLTADEWNIQGLLATLRSAGEMALAGTLAEFASELGGTEDKEQILVPEIDASFDGVRLLLETDNQRNAWEAIFKLAGRLCRVRRDSKYNAILTYEDFLPKDIGPMLILDASGEQRETYRLWSEHRKGLSFLPSPKKLYNGLTAHHWDKGSGREAKKKGGEKLVEGVVRTIEEIPQGKSILIVHRKPRKGDLDWKKEIEGKIEGRENVHFLTWGQHTATNKFCDCEYVILADVYFYPTSQYEAIGRGAKNATVYEDFSENDFDGTRLGEIAHNTFQAACRGAVRKSVGLQCPEGVHLYMIFSTRKGTGFPQALLARIFPECSIVDWEPVAKGLTDLQKKYLALSKAPEFEKMKRNEIAAALEIKPQNLRRLEDSLGVSRLKPPEEKALLVKFSPEVAERFKK